MLEKSQIREPIVQGIFYPDTRDELKATVERILQETEDKFSIESGATAIISPHASYEFCGTYIGSAFLAATGRDVQTVVIIGPVHREPEDAIYLTESKYFYTPLGNLEVDEEIVSELEASSTRIFRNDIPHLEEHAIEVQLPFIQYLFPGARIVPILLGRPTLTNARILKNALDTALSQKEPALFVASSNLSSHTDRETAAQSVKRLIDFIDNRDCEGLLSAYHKKEITACGSGCIAALICGTPRTVITRLLSKTSEQLNTGGSANIIHYGAIAMYPSGETAT